MKAKFRIKKLDKEKISSPFSAIVFVVLIIYSITLIYPMVWAFLSTFKSYYEFNNNIIGFPKNFVLDNYVIAITKFKVAVRSADAVRAVKLPMMFLYSFLLSGGCAFASAISHFVAAYATAKFSDWKFSKILTSVVVFCMVLPIVGNLPSSLQMARVLGLYDKIWGSWIRSASFMGIYFLVLQGMISGVPKAFDEAAKIDGANNWTIMFKINFPMVFNILQTIFLLQFIASWNGFREAMLYLPSYPVVAYGLYLMFKSSDNTLVTVTIKLTCTMLLLIPMLTLFICFHKKLMGNLTVGGLKG